MGLFRTRQERLADQAARRSGASSNTAFEDLIGGITGSDAQADATQAQQDAITAALEQLGYNLPEGGTGTGAGTGKAVAGYTEATGPVTIGATPFQEYTGADSGAPGIVPDAGPRNPLDPYIETGQDALSGQADLLGLNGPEAQQAAIAALESGPMFTSMMEQGENTILQNASATGGLRGGNTQAALGTLGPQILSGLIQNQLGGLGGVAGMGLGAAGQGAGLDANNTSQIIELLLSGGDVEASGLLAGNQSAWTMYQDLLGLLVGMAGGLPTG